MAIRSLQEVEANIFVNIETNYNVSIYISRERGIFVDDLRTLRLRAVPPGQRGDGLAADLLKHLMRSHLAHLHAGDDAQSGYPART
jgi:hypothetical protein